MKLGPALTTWSQMSFPRNDEPGTQWCYLKSLTEVTLLAFTAKEYQVRDSDSIFIFPFFFSPYIFRIDLPYSSAAKQRPESQQEQFLHCMVPQLCPIMLTLCTKLSEGLRKKKHVDKIKDCITVTSSPNGMKLLYRLLQK